MAESNKSGRIPAKQRRTRFVREYLKEFNATKAAIAAGYSEKGASVTGSRLLADPRISAEVEAANDKINNRLQLTVERVREEIARIAYCDPRKFFNDNGSLKAISELDEDSARAMAGIDCTELFEGTGEDRAQVGYMKKLKLWDKNKALELASRHLGALRDKVEVSDSSEIVKRLAAGRSRMLEKTA